LNIRSAIKAHFVYSRHELCIGEEINPVVPAFPIVPDFGNSGFFPGHYSFPVILAIQSVWQFSGFSGQCKEKKFKKKKHSEHFSVASGNGNWGLNQKPHEQMVNYHRIARVSYKIPDPP
jgi:hypothetical protein